MPVGTGIHQSDWLAVFNHVGNDQDFRMMLQVEAIQYVHLQRTEAAAEGDVLFR